MAPDKKNENLQGSERPPCLARGPPRLCNRGGGPLEPRCQAFAWRTGPERQRGQSGPCAYAQGPPRMQGKRPSLTTAGNPDAANVRPA
jgi:hypothetical protein